MPAILALVAIVLLSYALRTCFITLVPASLLPGRVRGALDDVAPAVIAALLATQLHRGQAQGMLQPTDTLALAVAAIVAWRSRNLALTCGLGMATAIVLRAV